MIGIDQGRVADQDKVDPDPIVKKEPDPIVKKNPNPTIEKNMDPNGYGSAILVSGSGNIQ